MLTSHPNKDRPQHRIGRYAIVEGLEKHLKSLAAAGPLIERGNLFICHALIMHPIADTGRSTLVVYLCLGCISRHVGTWDAGPSQKLVQSNRKITNTLAARVVNCIRNCGAD